jgi:hypothetical protein
MMDRACAIAGRNLTDREWAACRWAAGFRSGRLLIADPRSNFDH